MREIKITIRTGYQNCTHEQVIEVEDDTTDEEIQVLTMEFMNEVIEPSWEEVEQE